MNGVPFKCMCGGEAYIDGICNYLRSNTPMSYRTFTEIACNKCGRRSEVEGANQDELCLKLWHQTDIGSHKQLIPSIQPQSCVL